MQQRGSSFAGWEAFLFFKPRVWFNSKGIAFKSNVKANGKEPPAKDFLTEEYKDFKPRPTTILANSKIYQDLFIKSM
jgi:hypothetical protein